MTEEKPKTDDVLVDAIRELTKEIGALKKSHDELKAECSKWYNAGRFGAR